MKKTTVAICTLLMLAVWFVAAGCGPKKSEAVKCQFCKMMVALPEQAQGAKIVFKDGREEYYCVFAHAARGWQLETGPEASKENPPVKFLVVEFGEKKLIEARKSYFVFGSDVPARMFTKSVIAFGAKKAADEFAKEHGGTVLGFDEMMKQDLMQFKKSPGGEAHSH